MLMPFMAMVIALSLAQMAGIHKRLVRFMSAGLISLVILFEAFFSVNGNVLAQPIGPERLLFTKVVRENEPYGFNRLEIYLHDKFDNRVTTLLLEARRQIVASVMRKNLTRRQQNKTLTPVQALVVYDVNLNWYPRVWYLNRRALYHGLPLITADDWLNVTAVQGEEFYRQAGFDTFIFIKAEKTFLSDTFRTEAAAALAQQLENASIQPKELRNPQGGVAFKVYEFR